MMANATPPVLAIDSRFGPLAQLSERLSGLDVSRVLVNLVDLAEPSVLPFLADQFHVMGHHGWAAATNDESRRELIKSAIELHRYKGTPWAVKQALSNLGLEQLTLIERPAGAHWAEFDIDITVTTRPVTAEIYPQMTALIDTYKPARSHLRRLVVSLGTQNAMQTAAVTFGGDTISIQPYQTSLITSSPAARMAGIRQHDWGTITIYPRPS
ncbi:MAG: phage tail protein I [Proteobacteria bacterium]|nr:phage tail protein I [Pseudomonadota bacterium]